MDIQINTYKNLKAPQVVSTIDVNEWFQQIKQSPYSRKIRYARDNPNEYDLIKSNIPCVSYNFQYNGYKKDENLIQSTGILYIDVDTPEFNIHTLDKDKVFSYYKSFGGQGYAILVRVSGLTHDNFRSTYQHIIQDLGLRDFVDTNAIKPSQFNVLSYDENLFLNRNSTIYPSIPAPPSMLILNKKKIYAIDGGSKSNIRFDNLDEIEINGDHVVNWDGFDYIRCFIPSRRVRKGNRNAALLSYSNNLVYLNPTITPERTLNIMNRVNDVMCLVPLEQYEIIQIIHSVFRYLNDGSLKPIYNKKKRKIVFSPTSDLTREDKLEICRTEIIQYRRTLSEQKLKDIIHQWDLVRYGKITQRGVYKNYPISKKTTNKYWYLVKDLVKEMNGRYKGD